MSTVKIDVGKLRGSIYRRGKNSYRVQLSLGRNADGEYEIKRETIIGTEQDAIDLLTRWNVEYLDNTIIKTTHQTVGQAYDEWIDSVGSYLAPNTRKFYERMFDYYVLPSTKNDKLKDLTVNRMQKILKKYPNFDWHIKAALSTFMSWCVTNKKIKSNNCNELKTVYKLKEKAEDDVWSFEQVEKVYGVLTYENLYDIFITFGIETAMRPQEILAVTWSGLRKDAIVVDSAIKERNRTDDFTIGTTKEEKTRVLVISDFLAEKLAIHKHKQKERIAKTRYYVDNDLVVADRLGGVPNMGYLRKYMASVADRAEVHYIPPKNLRSTHLSLLAALNTPLTVAQAQAGHALPGTTARHYIRTYDDSLKKASENLQKRLHG